MMHPLATALRNRTTIKAVMAPCSAVDAQGCTAVDQVLVNGIVREIHKARLAILSRLNTTVDAAGSCWWPRSARAHCGEKFALSNSATCWLA